VNSEAERGAANDIDNDLVADGFFFHDTLPTTATSEQSPRYSPPIKRSTFDKWSALGERRRAYAGTSESEKSPDLWKGRRNVGLGFAGFGAGVWDHKANNISKDKVRECPWNKDSPRVRDRHVLRKDKQFLGDLEWIGGLHDIHL